MVEIHLNQQEQQALDQMRAWALAQGEPKEKNIGQLSIAQRIIDSKTLGATDIWKMNAVGVLFGDALERASDGRFSWVVVEDVYGAAFALRWEETEALVYPLSAVRTRLQAHEAVDVRALYAEYASMFPFRTL